MPDDERDSEIIDLNFLEDCTALRLLGQGVPSDLCAVLSRWYRDGFATWRYVDGPGEDGAFGGSFHRLGVSVISTPKDRSVGIFDLHFDSGSADRRKALEELEKRLPKYELLTPEYEHIRLRRRHKQGP